MNQVTKTRFKSDKRIKVWQIKGQKDGPKLLITAGVHGGENTGIQTAFELIDYFTQDKTLHGQVTIVPIVNVEGYKKQTRDNPMDGKNISASGTNGETKPKNYSLSDAIADEILALASVHDYYLDLHCGAENRFLSHTYYANPEDIELARSFGLNFIVQNQKSKNFSADGIRTHFDTLYSRARKKGKVAFAAELGSGIMTHLKDINTGLKGILSFCTNIDLINFKPPVRKTPKDQVFIQDKNKITTIVTTPHVGNVYLNNLSYEINSC